MSEQKENQIIMPSERVMVSVDAVNLGKLLRAVLGQDYEIRELLTCNHLTNQGLNSPDKCYEVDPIGVVRQDYNDFVVSYSAQQKREQENPPKHYWAIVDDVAALITRDFSSFKRTWWYPTREEAVQLAI